MTTLNKRPDEYAQELFVTLLRILDMDTVEVGQSEDCISQIKQTVLNAREDWFQAWQAEERKLAEFVDVVARSRMAQKAYFKDRKQTDLVASKQLERDVDERIARIHRTREEEKVLAPLFDRFPGF